MLDLAKNLALITRQIREAEAQFGRVANSVDLLLVSKGQPIEKIQAAYDAGQRKFGENYLQEALEKIKALPSSPLVALPAKAGIHPIHGKMDPCHEVVGCASDEAIEWHFIGRIQSNKAKQIAEHFSWVHSVDSLKIAQRLNLARPSYLPPLNICLQVNISHELSKAGVNEDEILALASDIQSLKQLKLRGLMCIPENLKDFESQYQAFKRVADCQENLNSKGFSLDTLSMGMSQDFSAAIKAGSTLVRIGTAVFGQR